MPKQYDAARVFSKVRHNRFEEVQQLLEEGLPVDATDDNGNAMLHIACQNGHRRLAKVLLRGGANMNAQNNKGQTPLHFAFAFGYQELGQYLIAKAGADPTVKNHFGLTCYEGLGFKSGPN
jgi:ankyrin repeat protein